MRNVLRILKRDTLRLLKAPAALIVVVALMVLPSLYTWYNVLAFWNPYEATGNLAVSVVNQDAGVKTELTGALNVGDKVADELLANEKLNFIAQGYDEALADLEVGDVYAVYVIPEDFSECLISPVTGQVKSPQIVYYTNEKLGPVSPKITDTATTTLDQTINSMFVATVSETAAQAIDDAIEEARGSEAAAEAKAKAGADAATKAVADVRTKLQEAQTAIGEAKTKTESAASSLDGVLHLAQDTKTLAIDVESEASAVQEALAQASSSAVSSLSGVAEGLSTITGKTSTTADGLLVKAGSARALVDLGCGRVRPLIDTLSVVSQDMSATASILPDDSLVKAGIQDAANSLAEQATELQTAVDTISAVSTEIENAAQMASDTAATLDGAANNVSDALSNYSGGLLGSTAPTITSIMSQVNSACALLSAAASDLETTTGEAQAGLHQLSGLLDSCNEACIQTDALVEGLQSDINAIASDIRLLAQSDVIADLVEGGSLNAQNIGEFMGSPTKLETVQMYHPNAYGTAMAPLFMNLTFWIGAFMLVIIFRIEVDEEGIKKLKLWQRYLSRFALFAGIAVVQAIICCAGVLVLGVQVTNVPAFFVAAAVSALAYLSIIYALSKTLHHIGKALCVVLVFAQIPGGSGLYPLELTSEFFQSIYPFLPFSYGIDALREAIGGFYGNFFARDMGVLAAIFLGMIVLGTALGPVMSNVTRMAAHQIREGDLYNGEDAVVPERPFRISQVISAFSDREDFRENLEHRYTRFSKMYPIFIRVAIVLAIGVPAALAFMLALDAGEKAVLLTVVLLWLVTLLVFVLVVESMRSSFERQLNLERMSSAGAMRLFLDRDRLVPALASVMQRGIHAGKGEKPGEALELETNAAAPDSGISELEKPNAEPREPRAKEGADA